MQSTTIKNLGTFKPPKNDLEKLHLKGNVKKTIRDFGSGNRITSFNVKGNILKEIVAFNDDTGNPTITKYLYDNEGSLTSKLIYERNPENKPEKEWVYKYDNQGVLVSKKYKSYSYSNSYLYGKEIDGTISYSYNNGYLIDAVINGYGFGDDWEWTVKSKKFLYNKNGNMVMECDYDYDSTLKKVIVKNYDNLNNRIDSNTYQNCSILFSGINLLIKKYNPFQDNKLEVKYEYDSAGNWIERREKIKRRDRVFYSTRKRKIIYYNKKDLIKKKY